MVTADEKREFLEQWLACLGTNDQTPGLQNQLYELLMKDTTNGKLYKYRSFDKKGYSIKSLKEGALYCASPAAFNDPFDCKIGITLSSLAQAIAGPAFAVMEDVLASLLGIIEEKKTLYECGDDEQRILTRLLSNDALMNTLRSIREADISEGQRIKALKKNSFVVFDLLQAVIADEFFAPILGPTAKVLPLIMENITMDGMEIMLTQGATYDLIAKAMGIPEDDDEIGLSMQISEKILPDQQEDHAKSREIIADLENNLIGAINKLFRVGCLCTNYKNSLMWSHYADSHRGFCVEYDFAEADMSTLPFPVVYSNIRPQVPWGEALTKSPENTAKATSNLMIGLLTKDKCWEYENEWRFLMVASASTSLKMPKISCIYLGALIEDKNRNKILQFARKHRIPVRQMTVDRGEYKLHASEVFG